MPAAVNAYIESQSYIETLHEQRARLDVSIDFRKICQKNLQKLYESAPQLVAKHFRYSKIDPESTNPSREYKNALRKFNQAGIIFPIHATSANGLPLKAEENEKKFKLLFLDIGLLQCALKIDRVVFSNNSFHQVNSGTLAEQFVGQGWLAYGDPYLEQHLFFWESEKKGSSAEIDYVINLMGKIVPIEVKAGKTGRLNSLHRFLEKKQRL